MESETYIIDEKKVCIAKRMHGISACMYQYRYITYYACNKMIDCNICCFIQYIYYYKINNIKYKDSISPVKSGQIEFPPNV